MKRAYQEFSVFRPASLSSTSSSASTEPDSPIFTVRIHLLLHRAHKNLARLIKFTSLAQIFWTSTSYSRSAPQPPKQPLKCLSQLLRHPIPPLHLLYRCLTSRIPRICFNV